MLQSTGPICGEPRLLLSVREAAKSLGVCEKTVYNVTHPRGDLPCVKIGTRRLYSPDDLARWIEKKKGGAQ